MSIEIYRLQLGPLGTNSYLIGERERGEAILIDPVGDLTHEYEELLPPRLLAFAAERELRIALILATHAHWDHVLSSSSIQSETGAPFYAHHRSDSWLQSQPESGARMFGEGVRFPAAAPVDRWLVDGPEEITHGNIRLETRYTPGHSTDHLSYVLHSERTVFSGDALFANGIGRWDLPGGDHEQLLASIRAQLLTLDDDYRVYPGHGELTTIGHERRTNPYLLHDSKI